MLPTDVEIGGLARGFPGDRLGATLREFSRAPLQLRRPRGGDVIGWLFQTRKQLRANGMRETLAVPDALLTRLQERGPASPVYMDRTRPVRDVPSWSRVAPDELLSGDWEAAA